MKAIIKKGFDRGYFLDVIKHVNMITKIPNNVVFYIIHNKSDCISAINKLTAESPRLFLHAYKLQFVSPDGKALTIETDLPEELQNFLDDLSR